MHRLVLFLLGIVGTIANAAPPNILFIAVDDLRPELACYGTKAVTPNLDALAAGGVRFDRAYCNQAVCGASRVSLMTGLYPERTGERTYHVTDWRKRHAEVITLNQHFKANGYTTVGLGKIYHGTNGPGVDPDNWSRWIPVKGKTTYADPGNQKVAREKAKIPRPGGRKGGMRGPATEFADVPDNTYADGARTEVALGELKKLAKADKPFFLAVGFTKPHLPFIAPQKYWDLYKREQFGMPDNLSIPPGYPTYAANTNAGELRSYGDIPQKVSPKEFPDELNKRLIHGYHACVSYIDAQVGRLVEALEQNGVADNTVVVFWADHGWKLGDHSSWCKHTNFECDTRVPLIVRAPGKAKGPSVSLVELVDVYPTLCELAGIEAPPHLQGKSFTAVLEDPKVGHRESAYSSYPHAGGRVGHSIRSGAYRYTEWWKVGSDEVVDAAATNLKVDPGETTNLLPQEENLRKMLSAMLKKRVLAARRR